MILILDTKKILNIDNRNFEIFNLKGHTQGSIGILTDDKVLFLGQEFDFNKFSGYKINRLDLENNIIEFEYKKFDGTIRKAKGTTNEKYIDISK